METINISNGNSGITFSGSSNNIHTSTTSAIFDFWGTPEKVDVRIYEDRVEFIYKQYGSTMLACWPPQPPPERVYKIVYSCIDGKWNKSEPIYGKIIPACQEYYEFD